MGSTFKDRAARQVPRLQCARAVERQRAQTLVFFALALTAIILLCGFAIDSGLLFLAKARISRAVDGGVLAAVGDFHPIPGGTASDNGIAVATIMRNFAAANYTDLATVETTNPIIANPNTTTSTYDFVDTAAGKDTNGAYRRFIMVTLTSGAGGQITSAQCNARCPVHTYFIGIFGHFTDLKVSSGATATRNPRLIMVVVDRSGSMLTPTLVGGNPGAVGLPAAIVTFLNFFDTSSDYIGLVSFGSNARLEMPLTTNFLYAATNDLYEAYDIVTNSESYQSQSSWYVPGPDPEHNAANYYTQGVRRFRFGGQTAADEGIRMALEQMMANTGWSNPNVVKYMVIFTDGAWNTTRTMVAAPGYTNVVEGPPTGAKILGVGTSLVLTNSEGDPEPTAGAYAVVPAMAPLPSYWSAITNSGYNSQDHLLDIIQSLGTSNDDVAAEGNNYLSTPTEGAVQTYITNTFVESIAGENYYTTNVNVWVPPGAVDYVYRTTNSTSSPRYLDKNETIVSEMDDTTNTVNINLGAGDSNVLVMPGYLIDGIVYDGLDLAYPSSGGPATDVYTEAYNFLVPWMWEDAGAVSGDGSTGASATGAYESLQRDLVFRNYMNLLTGFYVFRPDDPAGYGPPNTLTGAVYPLNPVGPYYPSAAFYWPFDLVGVDQYPTFALRNPSATDPSTTDPSPNGKARAIAFSINMLSTNAAPEWSGELFYEGQNAQLSGTTSASSLMTSKAAWQAGMPGWISTFFDQTGENITETDPAHNPTQLTNVVVWRPNTFNGSNNVVSGGLPDVLPDDTENFTGGYVKDSAGNIYRNAMAWSGRPTHYFDFSRSTWVPIATNHVKNVQMLPLGNWKAAEYCWHARAAGVTIYTVGYGTAVTEDEQVFLATLANATNTTAGPPASSGTNFLPGSYNTQQPIGQQFYATNADEIGVDFSNVATAINAALTQ